MLYSSGTTGRPKGIQTPLPQGQVDEIPDAYTAVFAPMYGFDENSVYLSPAPLYHAAPLRYCGTTNSVGGTVVFMDRFEPEEALRLIETYHVTHSQWVPTMFIRMLKLPEEVRSRYDVSSMKVAIHAAAPCPAEVKRAMIEWWGPVIHEYYASTEPPEPRSSDPRRHWIILVRWASRYSAWCTSATRTATICHRRGRTGLLRARGGRLRIPQRPGEDRPGAAPRARQLVDHRRRRLRRRGRLPLPHRPQAFMIISGGVNIYPQEAENVLVTHPAVFDVGVIGVPDPDLGEVAKACVQLAPGFSPSDELAAELLDFTREKIAGYKVPRSVDFVDDLPRTPTGKLVKGILRKAYWPSNV